MTVNQKGTILIVDDDREMLALLEDSLAQEGYRVQTATGAEWAIARLEETEFDLVLTDLRMPGMNGMELLGAVKRLRPEAMVIILTAFGSIEGAVEAIKAGAYHFLPKPIKMKEVSLLVGKALEEKALRQENVFLRREVERKYQFENMIGKSKKMQEVFELIRRVAATTSNVLIIGESGTGKELVAKAIHYNGARKHRPFIPINCTAIPEGLLESELFGHMKGAFTGAHISRRGLFEEAPGGTLFLDEIGDMGLALQAKLLRVLETKEIRPVGSSETRKVDVRIIAATNRDLEAEVRHQRFREALYYRLNVIPLRIPTLRERPEDIPLLAEHFVKRYAKEMGSRVQGIAKEAMALLIGHPWKGNVRELENVIERSVALCTHEVLRAEDLLLAEQAPSRGPVPAEPKELSLDALEQRHIAEVLKITGFHKGKAAALLGIHPRTLSRLQKRYGLPDEKPNPTTS
ncbi:MAG: sigma-54-dependent Fis family transcriptional regulator [Deltaproteobacteria bacterium]|nr:sigma-54-dependent Fis family transcriptional regulator [Deltaproteobacteria bacterium]